MRGHDRNIKVNESQPFHTLGTGAASALSIGTLRGPPLLGPTLVTLGGAAVVVGTVEVFTEAAGLATLAVPLFAALELTSGPGRFSFTGAAVRVRDDVDFVLALSTPEARGSVLDLGFLSSSGFSSASSSGRPSSAARLIAGSFL